MSANLAIFLMGAVNSISIAFLMFLFEKWGMSSLMAWFSALGFFCLLVIPNIVYGVYASEKGMK